MENGNRHLFASALTGKGFRSFWEEILAELQYLYLLQGSSREARSVFLRLVGQEFTERGCRVNYCHRPGSRLALEGLVIMPLRSAVLDRSLTDSYGIPVYPYLRVAEIDLGPEEPEEETPEDRWEAARSMEEAFRVWRETCASNGPHGAARGLPEVASGWLPELLAKPLRVRRFFAGTVTGEEHVNLADHLTSGCRRRYFIGGAPGSGGPMMHRVLLQGLSRHWEVEAFHSDLDPDCLVALIFPEAGMAVVDGTGPSALAPQPGDIILGIAGNWSTWGRLTQAEPDGKKAELDGLLKAAGRALNRARKSAAPVAVTGKDAAAFVSRLLKETAKSRGCQAVGAAF